MSPHMGPGLNDIRTRRTKQHSTGSRGSRCGLCGRQQIRPGRRGGRSSAVFLVVIPSVNPYMSSSQIMMDVDPVIDDDFRRAGRWIVGFPQVLDEKIRGLADLRHDLLVGLKIAEVGWHVEGQAVFDDTRCPPPVPPSTAVSVGACGSIKCIKTSNPMDRRSRSLLTGLRRHGSPALPRPAPVATRRISLSLPGVSPHPRRANGSTSRPRRSAAFDPRLRSSLHRERRCPGIRIDGVARSSRELLNHRHE